MKLGDDDKLDQAVYLWFKQKRMEGVPTNAVCEGTATFQGSAWRNYIYS